MKKPQLPSVIIITMSDNGFFHKNRWSKIRCIYTYGCSGNGGISSGTSSGSGAVSRGNFFAEFFSRIFFL
jgi:hypothetical protein